MHIVTDEPTLEFLMNIKALVKQHGMTLEQVSRKLGKNPWWLYEITRQRTCPRLGDLHNLARVLDYDLSDSVNMRFFRSPRIFVTNLKQRIREHKLKPIQIMEMTGYTYSSVMKYLPIKAQFIPPIVFMNTIIEALDRIEGRNQQ